MAARAAPPARLAAVLSAAALTVAACGGEGFDDPEDQDQPGGSLTVMIGSSGEPETRAVQEATARFTDQTGIEVEVIPAQDLAQQLQQGFAGGSPPDLFYVGPDRFRLYVEGGSLHSYGDQLEDADDFYEPLRQAFTYDDELYCLPKDGGAHALVIDTDAWAEAGLTEADYPQDWDDLVAVAQELTTEDRVGLAFTGDHNPVATFLLAGGGYFVNQEQTEVTADTPENVATLSFLQENMEAGYFAFAPDVEAGWGGEAFGSGKAAMTVEGAWLVGVMENDYPDRNWVAIEMPEGPGGRGAGAFTNCWGIAAASTQHEAAVDLVRHLLSPEEQQEFTLAFGPIPSRVSLQDWAADQMPEKAAFAAGLAYGRTQVAIPGFDSVLADFNSALEAMTFGTVTPQEALEDLQRNGEAVLAQG